MEEISMDTTSSPSPSEGQNPQQQIFDFDRQHSHDIPSLFKNVWREDLEELERALVQDPHLVNNERFRGDALIHIAAKAKKLGALQTLLKHGAKVCLLDSVGETPLHIAVAAKWQEGIRELLQHGSSPDKFSEPKSSAKGVFPKTALHIAVSEGDNKSAAFLLRQSPDLSLCDGLQQTVLHMAAKAHNMKLLTRLLADPACHRMISQKDWKGNSILHVAIQKNKANDEEQEDEEENNIVKIVELLIENGIDVNSTNLAGVTPIYLSAQNRLPKVAKTILKSGADLSLVTNSKDSVLHAACESGCNDCLNIFFKTGKVNHLITASNTNGKNPFHLAIDSGSTQCCESLFNNGDHLGSIDGDGKTRCSLIIEKFPNALELFTQVFDKHVNVSKKIEEDPNFSVEFDYSAILRQQTEELQCSLISKLTVPQLNQLLKHPLIESFLFLKWNRLKYIFYGYVLIYVLFLMIHSSFIYHTYGHRDFYWKENYAMLLAIRISLVILYACLLIPGIAMVSYNTSFFKETETYYIIISILTSAFVVFSPNIYEQPAELKMGKRRLIEAPVAALSAMLSWGELMLLLGKFPKLGSYISMLSHVAFSMVKVLLGFSSLLMGFVISFSVLYRDQNVFGSFIQSIVKSLMMMIGEYNYVEMPKSENEPTIKYFGSILIVLYLFIVSILMTNLFIGVAVYDIGELLRHGKIERLYKQAQYIIAYENFLNFFSKHHCESIISTFARIGHIRIKPKIYPNRHAHIFQRNVPQDIIKVPKDVIKESIKIKKNEMGKENIFQYNGENDIGQIMKTFSAFYMNNLHKQSKPRKSGAEHKLLLNRLDNLEKHLQLHLFKSSEGNK